MVNYESVAHNLYAIHREEEFSASASKILPSLLDRKKQFDISMALDDIKGCYRLRLFSNLDTNHIDTKVKEKILTHDNMGRKFLFMTSFMSHSEMTKWLLGTSGRLRNADEQCLKAYFGM